MQCINETKFDINRQVFEQQQKLQLKIENELERSMILHGSDDHTRSIWRIELDFLGVNHVLNLVFQHPTIVSIIPRTAAVIGTYYIRIVVRRRSLRVWMRSYQHNQIHPQHML